jgi:hypothetical protein
MNMELYLIVAGSFIIAVLSFLLFTQRKRIASVETKFTLNGVNFSVKLHELVKLEVARVSLASIGRLAHIDRELIEYWEREKYLQPEDGAKRLALFETEITKVENMFSTAEPEDRVHLATQLRELYWKYLQYARAYWASSQGYHEIRQRVIEGLIRLEEVGNFINLQASALADT